jgi:steroid delta-isomerase-like uncharacterized protein
LPDAVIVEIVAAFYAAYSAHDADAAAKLYAEDARHEEVATGNASVGRNEIARGLAAFFEAFPDAQWDTEDPFLRGDGAAIPYTLRGTLRRQFGPFSPSGQRLELRGLHVLAIRGGRIARSADYWDSSTFARQMSTERVAEGAR